MIAEQSVSVGRELLENDPALRLYVIDESLILRDWENSYDTADEEDEFDIEDSGRNSEEVIGDGSNELHVLMRQLRLDESSVPYDVSDMLLVVDEISSQIKSFLPLWSLENNISHKALQGLMQGLREQTVIDLPASPRTILNNPRETKPIETIGEGHYCHFGLTQCVIRIINRKTASGVNDEIVYLIVATDGAPLGKSSSKSLWPLRCSCRGSSEVFIVGVFLGHSKPQDANEFLRPMVDNLIHLIHHGVDVEGQNDGVRLYALVCDAPAKAFILGLTCHSGYYSCPRCDVKGAHIGGTVCLPAGLGTLRTDEGLRQGKYFRNPRDDRSCDPHQKKRVNFGENTRLWPCK
ncbi:hypothetical protein QAD02_021485 [Eretmocerus hayati]|uniref:Uncharacterized protein n=1 Tax=Eretmocerus hayati TaxID=131215 RepID=A0ACC2PTJ1_9HYME|nr:hypothetical protein QAD02_021485 [Eretmocerus hayati]